MSRGGTKQLAPDLCGWRDSGRDNNGTTASVQVGIYDEYGPDGLTGGGDVLILTHVVDSTAAGVGQPNEIGNPWQLGVDETQVGPTGTAIRLRVWWKEATQAEVDAAAAGTIHTYTITNSFTARSGLAVRIIPWSAVGQGSLPLSFTVLKAAGGYGVAGGVGGAPALALPDHTGLFRDRGLLGAIVAYPHDAARSIYYNGRTPSGFTPAAWTARAQAFYGAVAEDEVATKFAVLEHALGTETLHGQPSQRFGQATGGTNAAFLNVPVIAVSYLIRPYQYPAPSPGASWDQVADDFTDPATLAARYDTVGSPTVAGGQLVLADGARAARNQRQDITGRALVVEVAELTGLAAGLNRLVLSLTDGTVSTAGRCGIQLYTDVIDANGPVLAFQYVDDGFGSAGELVRIGPTTRWLRIREEGGLFAVDYSADRLSWRTGVSLAHYLLADQLAAMRVAFRCSGTATARLDNVNPAPVPSPPAAPDRAPFDSTFDFMGAPPALLEDYHGRDTLVGIVDQGTTAAVRAKQNITMKARRYFLGAPPDGAEVFYGGDHGCLVSTCGVPTGGQFLDAVVFDGDTGTTIDTVMAGVLWCAQRGAKVTNVSIGGGGDDPIMPAVFGYIAANYDCEIFCATGNDYAYGIALPAAYSTVFSNVHSVGAWDEFTNQRAAFSNHHELMSGVAPGANTGGRLPNGALVTWNGTSAAAPHATNGCARAQTRQPGGPQYTSAQAGLAMNRNARPTGAAKSEQGGGAYDLARTIAVIGDPTGRTNVPEVAMPRFTLGQKVGATDGFNLMARAVELLGSLCIVYYRPVDEATGLNTWAQIPSGDRFVMRWTESSVDSYGGMWSAGSQVLAAPADGMYLAVFHMRWGTALVDDTVAAGGAYVTGTRQASILLNGTNINTNLVAQEVQPASDWDGGTTTVVAAILPMFTDEWVYGDIAQFSGAPVQAGQDDHGGTWFALVRLAPLAAAP